MSYRELLIGCGHARDKRLVAPGTPESWCNLVTLDCNPRCDPDVLCDLTVYPWGHQMTPKASMIGSELLQLGDPRWAFKDSVFDEIHAYEVLEHFGQQGDLRTFFQCFTETWRLLKPGGYLLGTTPSRYSDWLWADPGHTRAILPGSLTFLSQRQYAQQLGRTAMSDYRDFFSGDFDILASDESDREFHRFILRAVKPARL